MSENVPTEVLKQFRTVGKDFGRYWTAYEGLSGLLTSPYFISSVFVTVLMTPLWLTPGWWNDVIAAAPALLGFSLGGMALLMAFGNDRFKALLARAGGSSSRFVGLSASFVHFILIQSLSLLAALFCKGWYLPAWPVVLQTAAGFGLSESAFITLTHIIWGPSFFLFIYSILCAIAATFRIFNTTRTFVMVVRDDTAREEAAAAAKTEAATPEIGGSSAEPEGATLKP